VYFVCIGISAVLKIQSRGDFAVLGQLTLLFGTRILPVNIKTLCLLQFQGQVGLVFGSESVSSRS